MGIGSIIKQYMDLNNTNCNKLSEQTGISRNTLYSIINRDNMKIDFEVMVKICHALNITLDDVYNTFVESTGSENILHDSIHKYSVTKTEYEFIIQYRRLNDINKAKIKERMETLLEDQSEKSNLKAKKIG